MSEPLQHVFQVSASFARVATTCPRQLYLRRYASWEGWYGGLRHDDARARLAYALSKAKGLGGLVGTLVHDVSKALIHAANSTMPDPSVDEEVARAQRKFDAGVRDARAKRWERSPKRYPIITEVFYGDPELDARVGDYRDRVERCIRNLYASRFVSQARRALRAGAIKLLAADDHREELVLDVDGQTVPLIVMLDLALSTAGDPPRFGVGEIKTGRENPADEKQVGLYAWALSVSVGAEPEQVRVTTVCVDSEHEESVPATLDMMFAGLVFVRDGARAVRPYLVDGNLARNAPLPENEWPTRVGSWCRFCDQRALCPAWPAAEGKAA